MIKAIESIFDTIAFYMDWSVKWMIIATKIFGDYEYKPEEIITFRNGIPGYKEYSAFVWIAVEDSPFQYMQSVDNGGLSFIVTTPFVFFPKYEFDLSDNVKSELDIQSEADLQIYTIVSVRDSLEKATANLAAPIVVNTRTKLGTQYILSDTQYSIQQPLFAAITESGRV